MAFKKRIEAVAVEPEREFRTGIYQGHVTRYALLADGTQEVWSIGDNASGAPRQVLPAGTVTHPIMGVGESGAEQVGYWVDGAGRRVVHTPETKPLFGSILA